ncbi:hypothetical protein BH11PLA2_BH11PLA2_08190 [soil metagenome]
MRWIALVFIATLPPAFAGTKEIDAALATIKAVGKEGSGNDAAAVAWKTLAAEGVPAFVPTLTAFKDASPNAANWLRSAVDAIVEAETRAGRKLSPDTLKAFALDSQQSPDARRIAFELFEKLSPDAAKEIVVGMVNDPSLDLRRDAIARRIALTPEGLEKLLEPLFAAARDRDQVEELAKKLKLSSNDIVSHFNFVTRWHIVGPFDGPNTSGFANKYEPENGVDLKATYDGKGGKKIAWKTTGTKELTEQGEKDYSLVDLVKEIGVHKDAVAFAYAVIEVEKETPVDLRAASQNGIKIFLNGKSVFERDAYHQGTMMDQHKGKGILKAGKNELLLKICQNDQKEPWSQRWVFQARVCDSTGGKVPMTLVSPASTEVK